MMDNSEGMPTLIYIEAYNAHRFAHQFSCFQGPICFPTPTKMVGRITNMEKIKAVYLYFM